MRNWKYIIALKLISCFFLFLIPLKVGAVEKCNNEISTEILHDSLKVDYRNPYINPRRANPIGISLYGGSPALFVSIAVDYFVKPYLSLEVGGGAFGVYAGGRYHYRGNLASKNWTPYVGLLFTFYGEAVGVDNIFFLPLGIQYSGTQAFFFAGELSLMSQAGPAGIPLWAGLKLGCRF